MYSDYGNKRAEMMKSGKKNLRRSYQIDDEPEAEFPAVFENDGYEEDNEDNTCRNWSDQSKENRDTNKTSSDNSAQSQNMAVESIELKQKNTNVRQSKDNNMSPHSQQISDVSTRKPASKSINKTELLSRLNSAKHATSLGRFKSTRPSLSEDALIQSRSTTDTELGALPFSRSQSMRISSTKTNPKPRRRLLREMTLSDSDDIDIKDYGSFGKVPLPRRQSEDLPTKSSIMILVSSMNELINRGKVYQMVVIDMESCTILSSLPDISLSNSDATGMVKSLLWSPTIFKINVGSDVYVCFKHTQKSVQGRCGDVVMVMQKTSTCLVVAFSRDDTPGACQSEVTEFARFLEKADW